MPDEHTVALLQADQARSDFYEIGEEPGFLRAQLAQLSTRGEVARAALGIINRDGVIGHRRDGSALPMSADRDAWQFGGTHYRELADWLRELAAKCRLPNPQKELLSLARRYEMRAEHLDRRSR